MKRIENYNLYYLKALKAESVGAREEFRLYVLHRRKMSTKG
jgi:hypothetical protein